MKTRNLQQLSILLILLLCILVNGYSQNTVQDKKQNTESGAVQKVKYKVTFVELGSVKCIPCQKMQPIMKSIEEKYANQVNVVFYDVWTPLGKPMADKYNIQIIPTQVFLDENGKEFSRH